jgi:hypothetical protein
MATTAQRIVNGVNVGDVENTVNAIKNKADIAKFKFRLHNKWIDGGYNHATVGKFYGANQENSHLKTFEWNADEPPMLAGKDRGANPVEHLLAALDAENIEKLKALSKLSPVYDVTSNGTKVDINIESK